MRISDWSSDVCSSDLLVAYIRRENVPKAYYRDRKGKEHKLDRHFSFGKLRVLLLSEFGAFRSLCLLPGGKRISEAIKIDADPEEIINALKITPKRAGGSGRNIKYAYAEAIFDLRKIGRASCRAAVCPYV